MSCKRNWAVWIVAIGLSASCFADEKSGDKTQPEQHAAKPADAEPEKSKPAITDSLVTRADVENALQLPWPAIEISHDPSLDEILEDLSLYLSEKAAKPITFVVDHREMQLDDVDSLDQVTVKDVNIRPGTHTCEQVLDLIWSQLDVKLVGIPMSGHVLITSTEKAETMFESRFYDLTGLMLVTPPTTGSESVAVAKKISGEDETSPRQRKARNKSKRSGSAKESTTAAKPSSVLKQFGGGGLGGGGKANAGSGGGYFGEWPPQPGENLAHLIREQTGPEVKWIHCEGEGSQISVHGQYIAVRTTYRTHRKIEHLLDELRKVTAKGGPPKSGVTNVPQETYSGGGGFFQTQPESVTR